MTEQAFCPETFDIGPFRFECSGHVGDYKYRAARRGDRKVEHHSRSPQQVGDCEVTWWTELEADDDD